MLSCGEQEGEKGDGFDASFGVPDMEIPMVDDLDTEVELLWKLWHGQSKLIDEFELLRREHAVAFDRICTLARLCDKYLSTGENGWDSMYC